MINMRPYIKKVFVMAVMMVILGWDGGDDCDGDAGVSCDTNKDCEVILYDGEEMTMVEW